MASPTLPPLSRALTQLRSALDWDQTELAKAAGVRSTVISDYERGHKTLTREKLEELLQVMGLPPAAGEWALSFVQSVRSVVSPPGFPGESAEAERQRVEALAAETGKLMTEFIRTLLGRLSLEGRAAAARQEAQKRWATLKRRRSAERRMLVEDAPSFRSWALCELLCAESVKAAADNADRAVDLAELALLIANLAPGDETWRRRLQGYAWAHLGNARRVRGDLPAAEEAFARYGKLWQEGAPGDPGVLSEAQVLSLEASLRIYQCRLPEASDLLARALAVERGALRVNLLVQRARLLEWDGNYEGALAALRQVSPQFSEAQEPRVRWMLRLNLAWNLCHLGRYEEAAEFLPETQALTAQLENDLDRFRLRWLEGRIAAGLGRSEEALEALSAVRREFASRGISYDAALASLELGVLHLEQGRTREVKIMAKQMAPIFRTQGVHRQALAVLKLFCDAAEVEAVTVKLARQVVEYLYRARHNPLLPFEAQP